VAVEEELTSAVRPPAPTSRSPSPVDDSKTMECFVYSELDLIAGVAPFSGCVPAAEMLSSNVSEVKTRVVAASAGAPGAAGLAGVGTALADNGGSLCRGQSAS